MQLSCSWSVMRGGSRRMADGRRYSGGCCWTRLPRAGRRKLGGRWW